MVKIFIDPGHGGDDPGANNNGLVEKNITLQIGLRIRDILLADYQNVDVKMSRTIDESVSLIDRTSAANAWGADFLLSVHINSGGGIGFEDYIYPGVGAPTTTYQNILHNAILKSINFTDRGKKTADFHMLRESIMPAVLTENGFIDNANDAAKLQTSSFIEAIARGHVNGIAEMYHLPIKSVGTYHQVVKGDTFYSLSKQYGSSIEQIKNWNNLDEKYTIVIGQKLRVK